MPTAKIIVKDEVNVKIEGLHLDDRKTLVKRFEYEMPGARYMPAVKLGRWSGKVSYFQLGGSTYINLLDQIIPYLEERGYDIELDDIRDYKQSFTFNSVTEQTFASHVWPTGHPKVGEPIILRDYQIEITNQFLANPQCVQEIATGAGKTLITAALSHSCEAFGRTLVIVPNKSLVTQTEEDYKNLNLDVGVYFGDRKELGRTHTIVTWQSLNNIIKNTQDGVGDITIQEFIEDVVALIIDECHMAKADVLKSMLSGSMSKIAIRWGLTGTVPKEKFASEALLTCIGPVINKLAATDLQDRGVLANCHVHVVQLQDHSLFKNYQSELKYLLEQDNRLDEIANIIDKIKESGNTLILVDRITAGKELVKRLPNSVFVSGTTSNKKRKEEYAEVAVQDEKIIVATYGVAAVGINIPRIFNLVFIEPGKSFVRVIQSIGRGLRKAEDKDFVQIWDITSSCKFSKRHLTQRKAFYKEANYPFTMEKLNYK
jgi:superfamily II DNA or RNA helicase